MVVEFNNLTKDSLEQIILNKTMESKELDYKSNQFPDGSIDNDSKNKLAKEISAFANTNGGIMIIGIREDADHLPTELIGVGCPASKFEAWLSSFRQVLLSRIRPHLHGVEYKAIEIDENNIAIAIQVPKSIARPHSFWDGIKDSFHIRYNNGMAHMDIEDLRNQFTLSANRNSQLRQIRNDRISMILAGECVGPTAGKAFLVYHIIPEWSLEHGNTIDVRKLQNDSRFTVVSGQGGGWNNRFNADGYCTYAMDTDNGVLRSYVQAFHSGIFEGVEVRLFSGFKTNRVFDWNQTQGAIINSILKNCELLQHFVVPKPWHVSASIMNAKGYTVNTNSWGDDSEMLDRNIAHSVDSIWTDDCTADEALKPVFDSLSNAFGLSRSYCFDKDGMIDYKHVYG